MDEGVVRFKTGCWLATSGWHVNKATGALWPPELPDTWTVKVYRQLYECRPWGYYETTYPCH